METLGQVLSAARGKRRLTLRDIEHRSAGLISNGYLCQLEQGQHANPSFPILRGLSQILKIDYVKLLVSAGYLTDLDIKRFKAGK